MAVLFQTLLKVTFASAKRSQICNRQQTPRDRAEGNAHLEIYLFHFRQVWTFEVSPGHSDRGKC
jgi:hypothetical protein